MITTEMLRCSPSHYLSSRDDANKENGCMMLSYSHFHLCLLSIALAAKWLDCGLLGVDVNLAIYTLVACHVLLQL